ncbi:hypothetical protein J1605_007484 [Eschrichtius robustus]|uniref:Focal AT domain-containing protein n=1 Tax=Eschrichtius robustus TaxID=9764 RepID=A0AB34GZN4_ESCRO|nr:hypothetical protein J1605_007484 [Eschrichtius robustus]
MERVLRWVLPSCHLMSPQHSCQTGNQHIYQPVGKPDPAAPPKKPPRPGAPGHLSSLASLGSPGDNYNEGVKLQPQEISPPPTANLDRSNDRVYENVTGLVRAVIEMSSRIQPAPPEEYVPMVKEVGLALRTLLATVDETIPVLPASTHREVGPHPEGSVAGRAQRALCRRDLLAGPQGGTPAPGRPPSGPCGATAPRVGSRPEGRGVREDRLRFYVCGEAASSSEVVSEGSTPSRVSGHAGPSGTAPAAGPIEMAQKLLNSDLGELINKMKLAQQYVMTSLQQEYKKQMLTAAHALAVDAKNLLDVIDQARLKALGQTRPH